MPVTINGDGSIAGLSVGGLGSGVVNTATLADGAAAGVKLGTGSVIQTVSQTLHLMEMLDQTEVLLLPIQIQELFYQSLLP